MREPDIDAKRFNQRLRNFEKVYNVFQRRLKDYENDPDSESHQMSLIQAFEMVVELVWKVLKDYLFLEGFSVNTPKEAVRQAFSSEVIKDGEGWMEALYQRNLTSHTYEEESAEEILRFVSGKFPYLLEDLYNRLKRET